MIILLSLALFCIERSYVKLFDIVSIVVVIIIFGSVVTKCLSIYITTAIFDY